jgi:hypothetical protein
MKFYLLILSGLLMSQWCWGSGVDNSGGGPDFKLFIECENGLKAQIDDILGNENQYAWIQSAGNQPQNIPVTVFWNSQGLRTIGFGDMFCSRTLTELNSLEWRLNSSCEGSVLPPVRCKVTN